MLLFVLLARAEAPAPAMVTTVRGNVTLVEAGARKPAPTPPFLLPAGASLDVAAGGHVVLLRQGGAFTIDGPKTVDAEALRPATATADAVGDLLARKTSLASAGASRAAGFQMTRPVPGEKLLTFEEVRWRCDACGPQKVELVDMRTGSAAWTKDGEGSVRYDGERLRPGPWVAKIGGREFSFVVASDDDRMAFARSLDAANLETVKDPADTAQLAVGLHLLAGYPTDALVIAERKKDAALVAEIEKRYNLAP
ncbi:MAG: hypothetical protein ACOZNI_36630 [Myxococcota bacterium]